MKSFFSKRKTIDQDKTYDEPQLTCIPLNRHRQNYDFEVMSGLVFDTDMKEYLSRKDALSKGVKESNLILEEDIIDEHVNLAYRYEKSHKDKVNMINAKKAGFGVIRILQGENTGTEYMYCMHETIRALNFAVYGYLTHKFIDKKLFEQIKKDKQYQNELHFIVSEFGGEKLYNEIMSYHP